MSDVYMEGRGGPAFASGNPEQGGDPGMSLRDYFAGQVLASMVRLHPTRDNINEGESRGQWVARNSYEFADAMLAERDKSK